MKTSRGRLEKSTRIDGPDISCGIDQLARVCSLLTADVHR